MKIQIDCLAADICQPIGEERRGVYVYFPTPRRGQADYSTDPEFVLILAFKATAAIWWLNILV